MTTTKWLYGNEYSTLEEAKAQVAPQKARLDNNPTDWCTVKLLSGSQETGWIIPSESLTDAEINNISGDNRYSISSIPTGDTEVGLSASEISSKVREYRTKYISSISADKIFKATLDDSGFVLDVTLAETVDMSGYI